jgi:hypothetical protein
MVTTIVELSGRILPGRSGSGKPIYRVRLTELEGSSMCQHAARFTRWIGTEKR